MKSNQRLDPAYLRQQIVGVDSTFETPFGERLMVYCDYTASGRCLRFVESYLQSLQRVYANTHTEDDITGRSRTQLLHEAETAIKESVIAGPDGRVVAVPIFSSIRCNIFLAGIGLLGLRQYFTSIAKHRSFFVPEKRRAAAGAEIVRFFRFVGARYFAHLVRASVIG